MEWNFVIKNQSVVDRSDFYNIYIGVIKCERRNIMYYVRQYSTHCGVLEFKIYIHHLLNKICIFD